MGRKLKIKVKECRVCGCTEGTPCPPNGTGKDCRSYDAVVVDECLFCTQPSFRAGSKRLLPRIVGKGPINKKYISRHDNRKGHGYQVRVPVLELGRDEGGKVRNMSAWFADLKCGGRDKALKKAIEFRDTAAREFNVPIEGRVRPEPHSDVNIYWREDGSYYVVKIHVHGIQVSRCFYAHTWGFKENAYVEARRWRDLQRADLGLPPAPGALPVLVDFEERKREIVERAVALEEEPAYRPLVTRYNNPAFDRVKSKEEVVSEGVTLSKSTAEEIKPVSTHRWADFALNNRLQTSSGTHGKGKRRPR